MLSCVRANSVHLQYGALFSSVQTKVINRQPLVNTVHLEGLGCAQQSALPSLPFAFQGMRPCCILGLCSHQLPAVQQSGGGTHVLGLMVTNMFYSKFFS